MRAEISFDDLEVEDDQNVLEGCYRLEGLGWQILYFEKCFECQPEIVKNARWPSGITGVGIRHPSDQKLNKQIAKDILGKILGVTEWVEIRGPDSLQMK